MEVNNIFGKLFRIYYDSFHHNETKNSLLITDCNYSRFYFIFINFYLFEITFLIKITFCEVNYDRRLFYF
jgi:hypothetical protein